MSSTAVLDAVFALQNAVDDVLKHFDNGDLGSLSDAEFTEIAAEVEATRRRLATADYALIAEVEARDLASQELTRNAAGWLAKALRLTPGQARARVREAEALGERRALTGEVLEPVRPRIAEARQLGILDREHVRVMLRAFAELPPSLSVEDLDASERVLVDAARALNPNDLAVVARALVDAADPDGPEPDDSEPDPRRDFTLQVRRDGWSRPSGMLDPQTTAMLDAGLAARAKPRSEDPTGRDSRSAGQRRHDAVSELLSLALRADEYATATGSPITVHITMTAEQFMTKTGLAVTGHLTMTAEQFQTGTGLAVTGLGLGVPPLAGEDPGLDGVPARPPGVPRLGGARQQGQRPGPRPRHTPGHERAGRSAAGQGWGLCVPRL